MSMKWLGTTCSVLPNQKAEICESTAPLSGMPFGITTSKAEILSVATMRYSLPRSWVS